MMNLKSHASQEFRGVDSRGSSEDMMLWFRGTAESQLYAVLVASLVKHCKDSNSTSCHYVMQRLVHMQQDSSQCF